MLPDNERCQPPAKELASEDHTGSEIQAECIADLASVVGDAWSTLVGLLLSSPPGETVQDVIRQLPMPAPDLVLNWWLKAAGLCAEELVSVNPLTAAAAAIRAGLEVPPALRGRVVSSGHVLAGRVTSIPLVACWDFVRIIREGHVHRAAEKAAAAMASVVWRGELADLSEVFHREAAAIVALVSEVTG